MFRELIQTTSDPCNMHRVHWPVARTSSIYYLSPAEKFGLSLSYLLLLVPTKLSNVLLSVHCSDAFSSHFLLQEGLLAQHDTNVQRYPVKLTYSV